MSGCEMPKIKAMTRLRKRRQEIIKLMDSLNSELEEIEILLKGRNRSYIENYKVKVENQKVLI